jgi:hypothetical protein
MLQPSWTVRKKCILLVGILGTLSGIASIVLIVLDQPKIGGGLALGWILTSIACVEWGCHNRSRPRPRSLHIVVTRNDTSAGKTRYVSSLEELSTLSDTHINIASNSIRGK